jgi:hypothetical protein
VIRFLILYLENHLYKLLLKIQNFFNKKHTYVFHLIISLKRDLIIIYNYFVKVKEMRDNRCAVPGKLTPFC